MKFMSRGFAASENKKEDRSDTWLTPLSYVHALGQFDLDPCGFWHHKTAKESYELDMGEDGLLLPWRGRVWLNPPYSDVKTWLDRLHSHGRGVALVFARTDTKWAQDHMKKADSVFFLAGRIKFLKNGEVYSNTAGHGSMFLSYGEKPKWPFEGFVAK